MQKGLEHHDAAQSCRSFDAAEQQHIVYTMFAPFADPIGGEHVVGRARDLEVVKRHDDWNAALRQEAQDRRRYVMVNVVEVANLRTQFVEQLLELAACIERIDDFRAARERARYRIRFAELELVDEVRRPL